MQEVDNLDAIEFARQHFRKDRQRSNGDTNLVGNTERLQNFYLHRRLADILEDSFCETIAVVLSRNVDNQRLKETIYFILN